MKNLDVFYITYHGNNYVAAMIPDVFTGCERSLTIGSESLNQVLYNDENGYTDETARRIDETIYAYLNDDSFLLSKNAFIERVNSFLD